MDGGGLVCSDQAECIAHTGERDWRHDQSAAVGWCCHVLVAEKPARGRLAKGLLNLFLRHVELGTDDEAWGRLLRSACGFGACGAEEVVGIDEDAGGAVVEHLDHFAFVEADVGLIALVPGVVGAVPESVGVELFGGAEEAGVVGHVEHGVESDAPGVAGSGVVFVDEDGGGAVDLLGEVGVGSGTEDGAGSGVGVEEGEVVGGEDEGAFGIAFCEDRAIVLQARIPRDRR